MQVIRKNKYSQMQIKIKLFSLGLAEITNLDQPRSLCEDEKVQNRGKGKNKQTKERRDGEIKNSLKIMTSLLDDHNNCNGTESFKSLFFENSI